MPLPAGSSDTSGLGTQPAPGPFLCTQKPPRLFPLTAFCRCVAFARGVPRRAVLERSPCPRPWTHSGLYGAQLVRCQFVGSTSPDKDNLSLAMMLFKPAVLTYQAYLYISRRSTSKLSLYWISLSAISFLSAALRSNTH